MFQSTPAIADGRTATAGVIRRSKNVFQSTPAIADGRTMCRWPRHRSPTRFNPRPPSLTGEPWEGMQVDPDTGVSIHARHR